MANASVKVCVGSSCSFCVSKNDATSATVRVVLSTMMALSHEHGSHPDDEITVYRHGRVARAVTRARLSRTAKEFLELFFVRVGSADTSHLAMDAISHRLQLGTIALLLQATRQPTIDQGRFRVV
jgi:hypothetical protein